MAVKVWFTSIDKRNDLRIIISSLFNNKKQRAGRHLRRSALCEGGVAMSESADGYLGGLAAVAWSDYVEAGIETFDCR